ncbi:MAG: CapA family protein [Treponema sp.]|nr:CapA family protein [Treponema sp.]
MKRWLIFFLPCIALLTTCRTAPVHDNATSVRDNTVRAKQQQREPFQERLTLLFAGDIMAHKPNYSMNDYSTIWSDIAPLVSSCDFSFANIEAPVDDTLPYSTFPFFNMHREYPEAAIDAGFNVFSLVNNHSNDKELSGIQHTLAWAEEVAEKRHNTERKVFFAGLKKSADEAIGYKIIQKNGWTILFCATTEILNRKIASEYMNYVQATPSARNSFKERIKKIKAENKCDIFILSIHAYMSEYIRTVPNELRTYYYELLDCGVDIIWANHPHVVLEREFVGKKEDGRFSKLILYANGNTISAQRYEPQFSAPYNSREYTGDGLLYKVTYFKKDKGGIPILEETEAHYITTYITTAWTFVIKFLNDDFIDYLKSVERHNWARYITARKKIMEQTPVRKTWR